MQRWCQPWEMQILCSSRQAVPVPFYLSIKFKVQSYEPWIWSNALPSSLSLSLSSFFPSLYTHLFSLFFCFSIMLYLMQKYHIRGKMDRLKWGEKIVSNFILNYKAQFVLYGFPYETVRYVKSNFYILVFKTKGCQIDGEKCVKRSGGGSCTFWKYCYFP